MVYTDLVYTVRLTKRALKDLKSVPDHIQLKLQAWSEDVEEKGLPEVRKVTGYRDEPLKGDRLGQRSIRLSRAYRAIYKEEKDGSVIVYILEVNKHEY